jgi:G3E family GTPase
MWDKMQDEEHKKRVAGGKEGNAAPDEEQMQVDNIDWYDFVVVEKIDLYDDEEMKAQDEALLEDMREQERIKEQIR